MKILSHKVPALLYFASVLIPMYSPVKNLLSGSFPFWHDSAWGLLIGLENLEKIRLIGYEGGIPGVFYGPHWFWLVSLVQLLSKNPAVIATFTLFIPYFGIFPFLLWKNRKFFGENVTTLLWLAFIFSYRVNVLNLWQINLTPVVLLAAIISVMSLNTGTMTFWGKLKVVFIGVCSSLLINLNGILGWVLFISFALYLFCLPFLFQPKNIRKSIQKSSSFVFLFSAGFLISHLPVLIFELRHSFIQTKAMLNLLQQALLYNTAIVGRLGLTDGQIIKEFFYVPLTLFGLPKKLFTIFWVFTGITLITFLIKELPRLGVAWKKLLGFLILSCTLLLVVFVNSKNPIWAYHFIGVEIFFLLLFGILASKWRILKIILIIWVIIVASIATFKDFAGERIDPIKIDTLASKKYVVDSVYLDANDVPFSVFAYSPSLYTFDYDYLFKWLGSEKYDYTPSIDSDLVYLVIPKTDQAMRDDFINYRTPRISFETEMEWNFPNGVSVLKRSRTN